MQKSKLQRPLAMRTVLLAVLASFAMLATVMIGAQPAQASTTKKCTTTYRGVTLPWYQVDSMYVTRYSSYGKWKYKVTTSKKRSVAYTAPGGTGNTRYMQHHPEYVQMSYNVYYKPKTVWYDDSIVFTGINSGMDFKFVAHIQDGMVDKKTVCYVKF